MQTALEGARRGAPPAELVSEGMGSEALLAEISHWLDEAKAENVVVIDLRGKSSIGDYMLIATGRSDRHVGAIADQIQRKLKEHGHGRVRVEGMEARDWVLIDAVDVIVHVFRPEVREFYNLEKMWSAERPSESAAH
ncbi:MAG: ribosome silencing factor [Hyphomicrobiaceae bacterium]|nr:ribosome silencing factor [Hyphomicrobiaceae bacterium]